jgi:hypothetical protein
LSATAVLQQETGNAIHAIHVGRIGNGATILVGLHKIGRGQDIQMKRKCRSGQVQALGNLACGEAFGGMADKQAKNLQSRFLREGGKGIEGR